MRWGEQLIAMELDYPYVFLQGLLSDFLGRPYKPPVGKAMPISNEKLEGMPHSLFGLVRWGVSVGLCVCVRI